MPNKKVLQILVSLVVVAIATTAAIIGCRKILSLRTLDIDVVKHFSFSKSDDLSGWKEKRFKGRVDYTINLENNDGFVVAKSDKAASALFYKIKIDVNKRPILSWKWSVKQFPDKKGREDLRSAKKDDFGARIYVLFPAFFFTRSRALEYIWTEKAKEGTISPSPYSKNLQLMVIESGIKKGGGWVTEERDIYADYIKAFGEPPKYNIGAIAFMTDSDSTKSYAEAAYDDIKIGYKKE